MENKDDVKANSGINALEALGFKVVVDPAMAPGAFHLVTLKAQQSGVVLPERDDRAAYEAFYTERAKTLPLALGNAPLRYSGGQYINDFALFGWMVWEACLSEVARLNSSHVSAGETCACGGSPHTTECLYEHFLAYSGLTDQPLLRYAYFHGAGSGCDKPAASAGGVDERAAFDSWAKVRYPIADRSGSLGAFSRDLRKASLEGWQARAALTAPAPNHSEQVRVHDDQILVPKNLLDVALNGLPSVDRTRVLQKLRVMLLRAAAPSAGSQKEQGE